MRWSARGWSTETFVGRVDLAPSGADGSTVTWVLPAGLASPSARVTVMTARRGRAPMTPHARKAARGFGETSN
jgi:hypothetical protein